jgi:hypothetical protein
MDLSRLALLASTPFVVLACCGGVVDKGTLGDGVEEIADSLSVESELALLLRDEVRAIDPQLLDASAIARALVDKINAERAGCATAALDPDSTDALSITYGDCVLGQEPQSVTLRGTTRVRVAVADPVVTFTSASDGLFVNGLSTTGATRVDVDTQRSAVSFSRTAAFAVEDRAVTLSAAGTASLDDDLARVTLDAAYSVTSLGLTHSHTWSQVLFQEDLRFPVSGSIRIEDARGGLPVEGVLENDGSNAFINATQGERSDSFRVQVEDQNAIFIVCSRVLTNRPQALGAKPATPRCQAR